jgi:hypothetical protein
MYTKVSMYFTIELGNGGGVTKHGIINKTTIIRYNRPFHNLKL